MGEHAVLAETPSPVPFIACYSESLLSSVPLNVLTWFFTSTLNRMKDTAKSKGPRFVHGKLLLTLLLVHKTLILLFYVTVCSCFQS